MEAYTSIKSFSFLCRPQRIVGQKVTTNCRMAALPGCFPSSSCRVLSEYWNLVPNNTNILVKEIKILLLFKTYWCSFSVPQCAVCPTKETKTLDAVINKVLIALLFVVVVVVLSLVKR